MMALYFGLKIYSIRDLVAYPLKKYYSGAGIVARDPRPQVPRHKPWALSLSCERAVSLDRIRWNGFLKEKGEPTSGSPLERRLRGRT